MASNRAERPNTGPAGVPVRRARLARSRAKVSQLIAAEIVRDIVENDLQEGDRLPTEAAMLEEFDVGRASIREGLRVLEGLGLISIRQGQLGGPVVAKLRPEDLGRTLSFYFHATGSTYGELIEARLIIEPIMARLAAERRLPEQMEQLREALAAEADAPIDDPFYVTSADRFHYVVSGLSGNSVLDILGQSLRGLYQQRILPGAIVTDPSVRESVRKTHRKIGDAILAGKGAQAEKLMREHLRSLSDAQAADTPDLWDERVDWQS